MKDGLGPRQVPKARQQSATRRDTVQPQDKKVPEKPTGPVEIPPNLKDLSNKELMNILDGLGIKRDDCFEKSDLIKRIEEYKESKKGAKKAPYEDSKPA